MYIKALITINTIAISIKGPEVKMRPATSNAAPIFPKVSSSIPMRLNHHIKERSTRAVAED
jgi:hypothetical protein